MAYSKKILEEVKRNICKEAEQMRRMNKTIKIQGNRMSIPAKDREIEVVFYPSEKENAPLILGFHGGGFLFGGSALNDDMWRETGKTLGAAVASIEYRKSPEFQYLAALEDAYDAAVYFKTHAENYRINAEEISVMGASAGANLAATLCLYAKQKKNMFFKHQILLYPFLDCATDPDSKGQGSLMGPVMYVFNELHCKPEEAALALVSPVYASEKELEGLPHAIICYADNDNLKYEGQKYAQLLRKAQVPVDDMLSEGMPHGFYESGFGEMSEQDLQFLGEDVKRMILDGTIAVKSKECLNFIKDAYIQQ